MMASMLEHELHTRQIVENQGDDERDGGSQHVVHVEYAHQQVEDTPVNHKGDNAYNAELHQLFNQFSHRGYSTLLV